MAYQQMDNETQDRLRVMLRDLKTKFGIPYSKFLSKDSVKLPMLIYFMNGKRNLSSHAYSIIVLNIKKYLEEQEINLDV